LGFIGQLFLLISHLDVKMLNIYSWVWGGGRSMMSKRGDDLGATRYITKKQMGGCYSFMAIWSINNSSYSCLFCFPFFRRDFLIVLAQYKCFFIIRTFNNLWWKNWTNFGMKCITLLNYVFSKPYPHKTFSWTFVCLHL
jgi:hypothetical protein